MIYKCNSILATSRVALNKILFSLATELTPNNGAMYFSLTRQFGDGESAMLFTLLPNQLRLVLFLLVRQHSFLFRLNCLLLGKRVTVEYNDFVLQNVRTTSLRNVRLVK